MRQKIIINPKNTKRRKYSTGEAVVNGIFGGIKNLFKSKNSRDPKKQQVVIDKRTGSMDLTYILSVVAVGIVVVVSAWFVFRKLKNTKVK